jgi:hypothetical protein
MQLRRTLLASVLAVLAGNLAAQTPAHSGAIGTPANRIVGVWSTLGLVGPCGAPPTSPINAIGAFHAGGTLSTSDTLPDGGIPNLHGIPGVSTRGPGYGRWSYDPTTDTYHVVFRFNWFVNGFYHGYNQVDRQVSLSADGSELSGEINAARYLANGQKHMDFCGEEISERI